MEFDGDMRGFSVQQVWRALSKIDVRSAAATCTGILLLLAVWVWGGRAGWANGMVVTPLDAVQPIIDNTDTYRRATVATVSAAAKGFVVGGALAFAAAMIAVAIPALRGFVVRLAAIANAAAFPLLREHILTCDANMTAAARKLQ